MTTMLISLDSSLEFDKDGLRLWALPSEELGAIKVFISFIHSQPKNTFKRYIITKLLVQTLFPAEFSLYCSYKLSKSKMAAKIPDKLCFDHNFQITLTGKSDFTKPVDHACVW